MMKLTNGLYSYVIALMAFGGTGRAAQIAAAPQGQQSRNADAVRSAVCSELRKLIDGQAIDEAYKFIALNPQGFKDSRHDLRCATECPLYASIVRAEEELAVQLVDGMDSVCQEPKITFQIALNGWGSVIRRLKEKNVDLSLRDQHGRSLLHYAALADRGDAVTVLLRCGLDPAAVDDRGRTPLFYSMLNAAPGPAHALMRNRNQRKIQFTSTPEGWSPLHAAAVLGRDENITIALQSMELSPQFQQLVNAQSISGKSALHFAVRSGSQATVRALLEYGADAALLDKCGCPPIDRRREDHEGRDAVNLHGDYSFQRCLSAPPEVISKQPNTLPHDALLLASLSLDAEFARRAALERQVVSILVDPTRNFRCTLQYQDQARVAARSFEVEKQSGFEADLLETWSLESGQHSFSAPHFQPYNFQMHRKEGGATIQWMRGLARSIGPHYLDSILMESHFEAISLVLRDHGIPVSWLRGR